MNKLKIIIAGCLILFLNTAFSQSNGFIPESDAHWSLQQEDGFGGYDYSYYRIPETQYDTIIGSNHYSKIFNIPGILQPESYVGACRSDSSGKVFFVLKGASNENLIMDYNALEGDTVNNVVYMDDTSWKVDFAVDSIGIITVGSRSYKCVFLSNKEVFPDDGTGPSSLVWVELFGCLNGGIFNHIGCTGFSPQWITCMSFKDTVYSNFSNCINYYPLDNINFSVGSCVYPLSVEEHALNCSVYPNPAGEKFTAHYEVESACTEMFLVIHNVMGKEISRIRVNECIGDVELSSPAESGTYYVYIESCGQYIAIDKIVVTR